MEVDSFQTTFASDFNQINKASAQSKQGEYQRLLEKIIKESSTQNVVSNLSAYVAVLVGGDVTVSDVDSPNEPLSISVLRPLLDDFVTKLTKSSVRYAAVEAFRARARLTHLSATRTKSRSQTLPST
jgi:hypothetical protein